MSGKSKHKKGRRPQYRNRVRQQPAASQPVQAAAAAPNTTAPAAVKSAPATKAAPVSTRATTAQYPYFTSELKRIGIISAIIIVILIVLAIILT